MHCRGIKVLKLGICRGLEPRYLLTQNIFQRSVPKVHKSHIHKHAAPHFPLGLCQEKNEGRWKRLTDTGGPNDRNALYNLGNNNKSLEFHWNYSNISAIYDLT